jgi:hypothetical protein
MQLSAGLSCKQEHYAWFFALCETLNIGLSSSSPEPLQFGRILRSGREMDTRKAPAYKTIPLSVAQFTCEMSQNAKTSPRFNGFLPLKAVPLIGVRL